MTVTIHRRPGELDRLSEALLASFSRPVSKPLYRGSVWVILFTALTLGLWPLWKSIRWLRDFAAVREQRCWHFAEWFRTTENDPAAEKLQSLASAIKPNRGIEYGMKAAVVVSVLFALPQLHQSLYHTLYALPRYEVQWIFAILICGISMLLLLQLFFHQRQFQRFLNALNPLLARRQLAPVQSMGLLSFNPLDWIGGLALSSQGAAWPLFTIVSIGLFRGYVQRSLRVHAQIGDRVRDLLKSAAPPLRLPQRSDLLDHCPRPECGAVLQNEAKFCGRCGMEIRT